MQYIICPHCSVINSVEDNLTEFNCRRCWITIDIKQENDNNIKENKIQSELSNDSNKEE